MKLLIKVLGVGLVLLGMAGCACTKQSDDSTSAYSCTYQDSSTDSGGDGSGEGSGGY